MRSLRSLFLFTLFLLAGCATPGSPGDWDPEREALAKVPVCCRSPAEFEFEPVAIRQPLSVDINARSRVFEFAGEKSYFRAFRLPETANILSLVVIAEAPRKDLPSGVGMFYPGLVFLDENKEPVFTLPPTEAGYVDPMRLHALTLIGSKDRWRYFVVYTAPQALREGMPVQTKVSQQMSTVIPVGGIFVPLDLGRTPPGRVYRGAPGTPVGRLTISIDEMPRPAQVN
jgi:hypothetical protein